MLEKNWRDLIKPKALDVDKETFLFNTKLQITQASANIEKQRAILTEDDEIVSLRQTIRKGYQVKYDNGAGPLIDLLNATQKEVLQRRLEAYLGRFRWRNTGYYEVLNDDDLVIRKAIEELKK